MTLRTLTLGSGCVLSAIGSDAIGYGGAGALGCIVAAFVASLGWRKQGWDSKVKQKPFKRSFNVVLRFNFLALESRKAELSIVVEILRTHLLQFDRNRGKVRSD